jgi:hypothetical protein
LVASLVAAAAAELLGGGGKHPRRWFPTTWT